MSADRPRGRLVASALAVDVVLVVAFAALGRRTHDDGDVLGPGGLGLAQTAWPFLVALAVGWAVARAWRRPLAPLRSGLPIWVTTVVGGLLLRLVSGQGTAPAFIVVATLTLGLLLVGWRAVAALVARRA
ncbi:Protein of unknown function (DUF3054) [Labedella gwakjiensis]|uniref:DUF3054 domain-containing protein n=1 Tax=Labedella gwakjiensis TaxID=390269 RepID=A0A2P8GV12_9MICO|nr:DUF3054 domain-containing protein [Labedella gwakjiensis]PSL37807.1 Protein of unknown function (DUF3054) [Labedella gwakjiensis]RUQ87615.1 DUF3054 domain-containing protein [Labedella gwakjiensis]